MVKWRLERHTFDEGRPWMAPLGPKAGGSAGVVVPGVVLDGAPTLGGVLGDGGPSVGDRDQVLADRVNADGRALRETAAPGRRSL
jgi:hypothetical protein